MSNRDPSRRRALSAVLAGTAVALTAGAVWAAESGPPQVIKPVWVQRPTLKDIARVYPTDALNHGAAGVAVIDCQVATDGTLSACAVQDQRPAKYHFGEAGLKLVPDFRMQATDEDGRQTAGATVRIPIQFKLTDNDRLDLPPVR
jgi:protein TonB